MQRDEPLASALAKLETTYQQYRAASKDMKGARDGHRCEPCPGFRVTKTSHLKAYRVQGNCG